MRGNHRLSNKNRVAHGAVASLSKTVSSASIGNCRIDNFSMTGSRKRNRGSGNLIAAHRAVNHAVVRAISDASRIYAVFLNGFSGSMRKRSATGLVNGKRISALSAGIHKLCRMRTGSGNFSNNIDVFHGSRNGFSPGRAASSTLVIDISVYVTLSINSGCFHPCVTERRNGSIGVTVSARGAGMGRITVSGAGRRSYSCHILVSGSLNNRIGVTVRAPGAGMGRVTVCGTSGRSYSCHIIVVERCNGSIDVGVIAYRAGMRGIAGFRTGRSSHYGRIAMAKSRASVCLKSGMCACNAAKSCITIFVCIPAAFSTGGLLCCYIMHLNMVREIKIACNYGIRKATGVTLVDIIRHRYTAGRNRTLKYTRTTSRIAGALIRTRRSCFFSKHDCGQYGENHHASKKKSKNFLHGLVSFLGIIFSS